VTVKLARGYSVRRSGGHRVITNLAGVGAVARTLKIEQTRPKEGSITLTVEHSDDGETWTPVSVDHAEYNADIDSIELTEEGDHSVDDVKDNVRARWEVAGAAAWNFTLKLRALTEDGENLIFERGLA
jgi:hypothetical protein